MNPDNPQQPQAPAPDLQKLEEDLKALEQSASSPQATVQPESVVPTPDSNSQIPDSDLPANPPVNFPPPPQPKKSSPLVLIAIVLVVLALLAAVAYAIGVQFFGNKSVSPITPKACTQEAKICPDGSSVGRTGPNCEFTTCPTVSTTPDPTANWKTYTDPKGNYSFKYPADEVVKENANGASLTGPDFVLFGVDALQTTETDPTMWWSKQAELSGFPAKCFSKENTSIIGAQTAILLKETGNTDECMGPSVGITIISLYKQHLFQITHNNSEVGIQILSTFKFLDAPKYTISEISQACIAIRNSSKYWDAKYLECNGAGDDQTPLSNYCTKYGGTFVANGDSCRHAQAEGTPCGPQPAYYCSFSN